MVGMMVSLPRAGANSNYTQGQNHYGVGEDAVATNMSAFDKGGMRGLGLIAFVLAEIALKKKSLDLSKDYYKTNKKDFDFFKATHQPAIQQTVNEAMSSTSNPAYTPDYYASIPAGIAKAGVLDEQWFESRRRVHKYATGLQKRIDYDFAIAKMHGVVGGWNIARRYEKVYADEHNNRRFDRKLEVANIGIGAGNAIAQGLSSSVANLASAYDNLGDTISTIGNGAAAASGYRAGRRYAKSAYDTNKLEIATANANAGGRPSVSTGASNPRTIGPV